MKRFLLFCGDDYYPYGGWEDFSESFDDFEETKNAAKGSGEWWHIVDQEKGEIVLHKGGPT